MLIIHKNGNKTSIQPILKFMFNNIFCEMNIKKVTNGEALGESERRKVNVLEMKCLRSLVGVS